MQELPALQAVLQKRRVRDHWQEDEAERDMRIVEGENMKTIVAIPITLILLMGGLELNCKPDTLILCMSLITAGWLAGTD